MEQETDRARRLSMWIKVGLFILVGFVVAPVIFIAIKGAVGLGLAAVVGLIGINLAPVIADKLANWRLKAIKWEASKNPVETLQVDFSKRQEALGQFKDAINQFSAAVMNFSDKLEGFKAQFPQDSDKFSDQLAKMKKLLEIRRKRYKEAEATVAHYAAEIERARAIWQMGLEAAKMNKAAGMTEADFMQKIKVETALDSVTTSMNTAFAELETSLIEEDGECDILQIENKVPAKIPQPVLQGKGSPQ